MPPEDVGTVEHMLAYWHFRRYRYLTVDEVAGTPGFDLSHPWVRAYVAARLDAPEQFHFLFGQPGALAGKGRYLYHYTKIEHLGLIEANGLRASPMSGTNDPFEGRSWRYTPTLVGGSGIGHQPTPQDEDDAKRFFAGVHSVRERALALSFGRDPSRELGDDENPLEQLIDAPQVGFIHPAMWAHYGDRNQGVCLIFDRGPLDHNAECAFEPLAEFSIGQPVRYTRKMDAYLGLWSYEAGQNVDPVDYVREHAQALLFTKTPEWSYENEYRWVCVPDTDIEEAFVSLDGALIGALVGEKATTEQRREVWRFAKSMSITANVAVCSWDNPQHFSARRVTIP